MKRVVVGMSGGVDSAVCAYILKEQGYDVAGVTLRTWSSGYGDGMSRCCEIDDAKRIAGHIGIAYHVYDCADDFRKKVIDPFIDCYLSGATPNPCVVCNRELKWAKLIEYAKKTGADLVATGHYASVVKLDNGRYTVKRAEHAKKDQTYMLYNLTQKQLEVTLMPLGSMSKDEVRALAAAENIPVADKPDSQEICFVEDDDHARFIRENFEGPVPGEGDFVDRDGNVLGKHKGIIAYTVGQRKGLGLSMGHPVYVTGIDAASNKVVIGEDEDLFDRKVICRDVNFMGIEGLDDGEELRCLAAIRYRHEPAPALARMTADGKMELMFDEPVRAAAPGQSAVLYDDNGHLLCGGVIV